MPRSQIKWYVGALTAEAIDHEAVDLSRLLKQDILYAPPRPRPPMSNHMILSITYVGCPETGLGKTYTLTLNMHQSLCVCTLRGHWGVDFIRADLEAVAICANRNQMPFSFLSPILVLRKLVLRNSTCRAR